MNIQKLLQDLKFSNKRILENLICFFLEITREELWLKLDDKLDNELVNKIEKAYQEFEVEKKPIEYILWYVEFFGRKLKVNENTLIPRAETEYMIQWVNEFIQLSNQKYILWDVGTGSGVLWVSVKLENLRQVKHLVMADISKDALNVAKCNYENLVWEKIEENSNDTIIWSDLLSFVDQMKYENDEKIILVANLPYIPDQAFEEWVGDTVKKWEPKMAFVGGDDWLDYYRTMFEQLFWFVNRTGNTDVTMFLEMMTWQVEILEKEFGEKISFEEIKTFHFNIRIVKAQLK